MIYTDFSVKNYRGIRQCKLEKLELINLFFGKNNCGKSSLRKHSVNHVANFVN